MAITPDIVSATAAVVSAIGGAFAAWAAFRSAGSARVAQQAAADSERRASLRQIATTASEVLIEAQRVESRGHDLKSAYRSLFVIAGSGGGSRQALYDTAVDEKLKEAQGLADSAKVFSSSPRSLEDAPPDEIDRVQLKLSTALTKVRALREDIEREFTSAEGQSAAFRDKALLGFMP